MLQGYDFTVLFFTVLFFTVQFCTTLLSDMIDILPLTIFTVYINTPLFLLFTSGINGPVTLSYFLSSALLLIQVICPY